METTNITFTGKLYKVLFQAENTGFTVALYNDNETHKTYKCVGNNLPLTYNVPYTFIVNKKPDATYGGEKYEVESYEMKIDDGKSGVVGFLSSGLFKGVGPKLASKIYDKFKEKTLSVISKDPERLSYVKGLSRKKAYEIHEAYLNESSKADLYAYLSKYGFTPAQIRNSMKAYKDLSTDKLLEKIKANPYELINVSGITFSAVDGIGRENGIPEDSEERVFAALITTMKELMQHGHTGLELTPVITESIKLLKTSTLDEMWLKTYIAAFIRTDRIKYRKVKDGDKILLYLYTPAALLAENELSDAVNRMIKSDSQSIADIDKEISRYEKEQGITLDNSQKDAVLMALNNSLSIITGGPGTGKTTIVKAITSIWQDNVNKNIILMSPTGRAAKNLEEKTGLDASTIHSHYCLDVGEEHRLDDDSIIDENALIIIDEVSMLDVFIARDAMKRIKDSTVVLIGDPDQLPSVSPGNVLADLIRSESIPVARLKYIHRQGAGSMIKDNADKIRRGVTPLTAAPDFRIYSLVTEKGAMEETLTKIENKLADEYINAVNNYGLENVVCLVPFNKHACGQFSLNKLLQEKLNPAHPVEKEFKGTNGQVFRVGDPVMQLKNQDDISNGDVGKVTWVGQRDGNGILFAKFYDTIREYTKDNIEDLCLAYAMTVHKSQGSEYNVVLTALCNYHAPMLRRNILYTAITRAKKKVIFCGTMDAINKAVTDNTAEKRNSLLWYNIRESNTQQKSTESEPVQLSLPGFSA